MRLANAWIGAHLVIGCLACNSKSQEHPIEYQAVEPEDDVVVNPGQSRQKRSVTRAAVKPIQYGVIRFNAFNHTRSAHAYLYGLVIDSVDRPVSHCGIIYDGNNQNYSITDDKGRFVKRIEKKPCILYAVANDAIVGYSQVEFLSFNGRINPSAGDSIVLVMRLKSKTKLYKDPPVDNFDIGEDVSSPVW